MSAHDDENDDVAPYRVGYSKPPQEHKFEKGRSGNPKGRPKKSRNATPKLDPALCPTDNFILDEVYRLVTIQDNGKSIRIPAIQAATRAQCISAIKGNRFAYKQLTETVLRIEAERYSGQVALIETAVKYKQTMTAELQRCEQLGIAAPKPSPHPDDIEIDPLSGKITIEGQIDPSRGIADVHGLLTPDENQGRDLLIQRRDEAAKDVNRAARRHKMLRDPMKQKIVMEELVREQEVFDLINDKLPSRYKKTLACRVHSEVNENTED